MKFVLATIFSFAAFVGSGNNSCFVMGDEDRTMVERRASLSIKFEQESMMTDDEIIIFDDCVMEAYGAVHQEDGMSLDGIKILDETVAEEPHHGKVGYYHWWGYDWEHIMVAILWGGCYLCPTDCEPLPNGQMLYDDIFCFPPGRSPVEDQNKLRAKMMTLLEAPKHVAWAEALCECLEASPSDLLKTAKECSISFLDVFDESEFRGSSKKNTKHQKTEVTVENEEPKNEEPNLVSGETIMKVLQGEWKSTNE